MLTAQDNLIEVSRNRKSLIISIAVHAIFIILCGLGFFSCWEQPDPFVVPGEIGVSFGDDAQGSGDSKEEAENPVEDPAKQTEQPTDPTESVTPVTDDDSDLLPEKITPSTAKTTPKNNNVKTDPTKKPIDNNGTMTGSTGKGDDNTKGTQGLMGKDPTGGGGSGKNPGAGDGLNIAGWAFAAKPDTKQIGKTGVATINFTIDRNGKITFCSATSSTFTASELETIKELFKDQAKFKKLVTNESSSNSFKGVFEWRFNF